MSEYHLIVCWLTVSIDQRWIDKQRYVEGASKTHFCIREQILWHWQVEFYWVRVVLSFLKVESDILNWQLIDNQLIVNIPTSYHLLLHITMLLTQPYSPPCMHVLQRTKKCVSSWSQWPSSAYKQRDCIQQSLCVPEHTHRHTNGKVWLKYFQKGHTYAHTHAQPLSNTSSATPTEDTVFSEAPPLLSDVPHLFSQCIYS